MQSTNRDIRQCSIAPPSMLLPEMKKAIVQEIAAADDGYRKLRGHVAGIRVMLVDDHALIREGLRQLLTLEQDIEVVGDAVDGFDALRKIQQLRPDIVLMDIHMPVIDGIAVTQQVSNEFPASAVIILTVQCQQQQMLQALKNGAKGYLLKSASVREVAHAIRMVYRGGIYLEPRLTGTVVGELRRMSISLAGNNALLEKEVEIIRYVAAGMSNREIAEKLAYSEKTVKNYLSLIFQKLHLRDRTQVAIFALRHGLLPREEMFDLHPLPVS